MFLASRGVTGIYSTLKIEAIATAHNRILGKFMGKKRKILATSALIYANGPPHLGHLVGTIQSDIWVRLQRMRGHDCTFICGSDSHGTPIMIKAESLKLTPEALIEQMHQAQIADFTDFHIAFDNYYPTHSRENEILVKEIFTKHLTKGCISKRKIQQLFDPAKKMFLPDRYIKGTCPRCGSNNQYGDNCETCGSTYDATELINPYSILSGEKPIEKTSEHYFFKLPLFTDFLKSWLEEVKLQDHVKHKLFEWFGSGLKEWDISRDAPYFGFLIPGETTKYFYVWLDAPIGYMASFKNLCLRRSDLKFAEYWQSDKTELYHFIGKDIIYFHALFWPAILQGAGFRTPNGIFVNGFLTIDGHKMSKSRGTFISARTYLKHLNPEYLRYYFAAKLSSKVEDIDMHFDDFIQRINADLVGKFINIASRCARFINKNFDNKLSNHLIEIELYNHFAVSGEDIANKFENMEYSHAIREIMALADRANEYIDEKKPWHMLKQNQLAAVHDVCTMGINLFRLLMIYLKPVLPRTAEHVEHFLNIAPLVWQDKNTPLTNHTIREFTPLLTRIESRQIEAMKMDTRKDVEKKSEERTADIKQAYITIEDFNKIDLRVGKIVSATQIEDADKLLCLKVDVGGDIRQIFAGIKIAYQPEELIGRHVVVVANLVPRKMRFGESQGMVLATGPGGKDLWLISPDPGAEAGMKVK